MQIFGGKAADVIKIYSIALRLARKRGIKEGERFDKEFWEVTQKHEMKHKFKELKSIQDLNQYIKEG